MKRTIFVVGCLFASVTATGAFAQAKPKAEKKLEKKVEKLPQSKPAIEPQIIEQVPAIDAEKAQLIDSESMPSNSVKIAAHHDFLYDVRTLKYTDTGFDHDTVKGLTSVELSFSFLTTKSLDFSFGLRYAPEKKISNSEVDDFDNAQTVNLGQTVNVMGLNVIQIGYISKMTDQIQLLSYGGLGIFQAKNKVNHRTTLSGTDYEHSFTYEKYYMNLEAGADVSYVFNNGLAPFIGLQIDKGLNIGKNHTQSGPVSWLGQAPEKIEEHLDLKTGLGAAVRAGLGYQF